MRIIFALPLLVTVLAMSATPAWAQEDRDPIALFNEASDLAEKGQLADAIAIWLVVAEDIPDKYKPVIQVNLGLAYKQLGKLPEAWHHLNVYLKTIKEKDEDALGWVREIEEELKKTHERITIQCDPEDARVLMGGGQGAANSYRCPLTWWFKVGKQVLRVTAKDHENRLEMLQVKSGGNKTFQLKLKPIPGAGPMTNPGETPGVTKDPGPGLMAGNWWKWGLVGGGGAMLITGGVMHGLASSKNNELMDKYPDGTPENPQPSSNEWMYEDAYNADVKPKLIGAYVLYGLGSAAAVAGGVLLLLNDSSEGGKTAVAPMYVPGGGGVAWTWLF